MKMALFIHSAIKSPRQANWATLKTFQSVALPISADSLQVALVWDPVTNAVRTLLKGGGLNLRPHKQQTVTGAVAWFRQKELNKDGKSGLTIMIMSTTA
jgi:hypothetical protein